MAVDVDTAVERDYLATLADRLDLDDATTSKIKDELGL